MQPIRHPEWIRDFAVDSLAYLERQTLPPDALTAQIRHLLENPDAFTALDSEIYGLQSAPLLVANGGSEHLIALDHQDIQTPLFVMLTIVPLSVSELQTYVGSLEFKRRINTAVSRISLYHRTVLSS